MDERAIGIILRTRLLTETSLIVHWLTPTLGRIATVAKGARRPKSPFHGKLDLFFEAEFSFARSRRSDLHTLREVVLRETHPPLRRDLARLQQATYCAALIEQTTETETPVPEIFELFNGFLGQVSEEETTPQTVIGFEMRLLGLLGLQPNLDQSNLRPGTKMLLKRLEATDWRGSRRLKFSEPQISEAGLYLHGFLIYQFGKVLKGRSAALEAK